MASVHFLDKIHCLDKWKALSGSGNEVYSGPGKVFLSFIPAISRAPPIATRVPDDVYLVIKNIRSEESRTNYRSNLEELFKLLDIMYYKGTLRFQWDLNSVLEMNAEKQITQQWTEPPQYNANYNDRRNATVITVNCLSQSIKVIIRMLSLGFGLGRLIVCSQRWMVEL